MAASPTCTITGSSTGGPLSTTGGVNLVSGETVTITLASQSGVTTWAITVFSTDDVTAQPTLTVNQVSKTATFTMPSTTDGACVILQSQVNGGLTNGVVDPTLTTTFGVFKLSSGSGLRVGAYNMTTESNSTTGWTSLMNQCIRGKMGLSGTTGTSATGGAASALPALPVGYLTISINGTNQKIPYYT